MIHWVKWYVEEMMSERNVVSCGRTLAWYFSLFFTVQDAWFFHRTGHFVDNATILTQLSVITAFYLPNKISQWTKGDGKPSDPPAPPQ